MIYVSYFQRVLFVFYMAQRITTTSETGKKQHLFNPDNYKSLTHLNSSTVLFSDTSLFVKLSIFISPVNYDSDSDVI